MRLGEPSWNPDTSVTYPIQHPPYPLVHGRTSTIVPIRTGILGTWTRTPSARKRKERAPARRTEHEGTRAARSMTHEAMLVVLSTALGAVGIGDRRRRRIGTADRGEQECGQQVQQVPQVRERCAGPLLTLPRGPAEGHPTSAPRRGVVPMADRPDAGRQGRSQGDSRLSRAALGDRCLLF